MSPSATARLKSRVALWALAVRDSFVVLLPLTFFGVMATLLQHLPLPGLQRVLLDVFGQGWPAALQAVVNGTWGIFGLVLAVALSLELARQQPVCDGGEALPASSAGLSAAVNFMLCVLAAPGANLASLGHGSMLLGIAVGTLTPLLLARLSQCTPLGRLRLGYDAEPHLYHATRLTLPVVLAGLPMLAAGAAWHALPSLPAPAWSAGSTAGEAAGWWLTPLAVLLNQVPWFFGVHGGKVLDHHAQVLFSPPGSAFDADLAWRPLIDTFVHLGGSGATLGLVAALFIVAREGPHRRIAQLSALPSLFNINELLIFGLPLALNPRFLLPFLALPVALGWLALAAVQSGLVPLQPVSVPWTTPPLLSGWLLTGSWTGVALQGAGLLLSTLAYLPAARRSEAARRADEAAAFQSATAAILGRSHPRLGALQRSDQVGLIARGLLADLRRDLGTPALALEFQPKHDRQGHAVGVEALLRWTHARLGGVRTDLAVLLAEEGGVIDCIGEWVLHQACATKARWNARGLQAVTMAVNVSPLQLCDATLPAALAAALQRHGLAAAELQLEITESQAIPSEPLVNQNLALIADQGVSLALDDFGMGYSSLLHMRRFRVQAIKIDGSLSREVLADSTTADIIRTITALGRSQGVEVVAEFVETPAQRDRLAALGCDTFQGYLYSRALGEQDCTDYLLRHQPPAPPAAAAAGRRSAATTASG